jgi:hypothetical protein
MNPLLLLLGRVAAGEQFRKVEKSDYRLGFWHLGFCPVIVSAMVSLPPFTNQATVSALPFFIAFAIWGAVYAFLLLTVARRTPVPVSMLVAGIAWSLLAWHFWK